MKNNMLFVLLTTVTIFVTGCTTVDFSLPQGFSHGARKNLIVMKFAPPQSDVQLTASQQTQLIETPKTVLIENKRFAILSDTKGELTGSETYDFEVRPYVDLMQYKSQMKSSYGCIIKLDLRLNDKITGVYEEGFSAEKISGSFAETYTGIRMANSFTTANWNKFFTIAYRKALRKMVTVINETFPICGTVINIKNKAAKTEFIIDRGTNYGIGKNDEFIVYYVDNEESITPVAIAKGMIGKEKSQVTVLYWNTDDSEVCNELQPRIKRNDKSLLGNLFVVCRPEKKK